MKLDIVILAAGKGTRMKSALPKVLHPVAAKPMLQHVIEASLTLRPQKIISVIGHGAAAIKAVIAEDLTVWVEQAEQLGTGHAVQQSVSELSEDSDLVLVLYGDVPLLTQETLEKLVEVANDHTLGLLTIVLDNPMGYGRIIRDSEQNVVAIVEQKDASEEEQQITETNTGIMAIPRKYLKKALEKIGNENAQGEYYLTDIIALAVADGLKVNAVYADNEFEVAGINDRVQLAAVERYFQSKQAEKLMRNGATLADPSRIDIRGSVTTGSDCFIDVNVVFEGKVVLGDNVRIESNCVIRSSKIGSFSIIKANSHLENAVVGEDCDVGPYARLRPGSELHARAKVGNFVEMKKTVLGEGSKVNHLSYIGDTTVGKEANIGAGTITCNYDGVNKFKTEIADEVFVGSNSSLVAPVLLGKGCTIAAGSTITKDVAEETLAIGRGRQKVSTKWVSPKKKK